MKNDQQITLLVDVKTKRVGCVILQSMAGLGHNNHFLQMHFDNWETSITPDMKKITGTKDQWIRFAEMQSKMTTIG